VVVITVMAGDPSDQFMAAPTAYARELWARWGLPEGQAATAARRTEDREALALLGGEAEAWPWPDAVYRLGIECVCPLYARQGAEFDEIDPDDPVLRAIIDGTHLHEFGWRLSEGGVIHIPLSVGGHVDHRLVRRMVQVLLRGWHIPNVAYYEEFPYSAGAEDTAEVVQDALDRTVMWLDKTDRYRSALVVHSLDVDALNAKIAAIARYESQISSFWRDSDDMAESVRAYTEQVGGEREWRFVSIEHVQQ
jgi:hypothetical protein